MKFNGQALEVIRVRSGLSLRQLSKLSGVSFGYIREIEAGTSTPSFPIVQKLAAALKILPTALLADPGDPSASAEVAS